MNIPALVAQSGLILIFDPAQTDLDKGKKLRDGLSVVVQIGETLWLANDETASLERLIRQPSAAGEPLVYADHQTFSLADYVTLPHPATDLDGPGEADIEGLSYADGYLWLVGSHGRKRGRVKSTNSVKKNLRKLAAVVEEPNRWLLARIPVVDGADGLPTLARTTRDGQCAARLASTTATQSA